MGNYSQDPQTLLQDALNKGYTRVRFQQGKPVLDRELNLLTDLAGYQRLARHYIGNGIPFDSDGFRISNLDVTENDFTIEAGHCLVDGYHVHLSENRSYINQPHTENVAPLPEEECNVYLRVFVSEVMGNEDNNLNNQDDIGFETAIREKVEWEVLVTLDEIATSDHLLLAKINKRAGTVKDLRLTDLTLSKHRHGWLRLPFLPRQFSSSPAFTNFVIHARSGSGGAVGYMEVPVPPGITKIKKFRITGLANDENIKVFLYRSGWNFETNTHDTEPLLHNQPIIGQPFNELFVLNANLDAERHMLSIYVRASSTSDIYLIAFEFE